MDSFVIMHGNNYVLMRIRRELRASHPVTALNNIQSVQFHCEVPRLKLLPTETANIFAPH